MIGSFPDGGTVPPATLATRVRCAPDFHGRLTLGRLDLQIAENQKFFDLFPVKRVNRVTWRQRRADPRFKTVADFFSLPRRLDPLGDQTSNPKQGVDLAERRRVNRFSAELRERLEVHGV